MFNNFPARPMRLLAATALVLVMPYSVQAQTKDCSLIDGVLPLGCKRVDANTVVTIPVGKNTELANPGRIAATGFAISIDGVPVSGDKRLADKMRRTDVALAAADIRVQFDGLGAKQRLDLITTGASRVFRKGDRVTFASQTNYPRWLTRGEVRIIDFGDRGGPRTVAVLPITPNGQVQYILPEGNDLVAVHRVYDSKGRYDETYALGLSARSVAGGDDLQGQSGDAPEEGTDRTARRRIPVHGGAITVSGSSVAPGAKVQVLGETLRADPSGRFVLNRIVPTGTHLVPVKISESNVDFIREVDIPRSDWFYVGIADVTVGMTDSDTAGKKENYERGRLAFYVKGRTQKGYTITASADTGEEDLSDLFRNFDERDPRSLLLRLDPDDLYPTYGDDSEQVEDAPTSGKFFLKIEKDSNFFLWGNYRSSIEGGYYLRNERTLYGAQAHWESPDQTENGDARVAVSLYAAQPDNLPQRDVFQGTGGSVYFLRRQDISIGSETISIEVRDSDTGRVLERRRLIFGQDYDINYIQGVVNLTTPLNSSGGTGVVVTNPGGETTINLVAQYEFTPTAGTLDGYSYGGRVEGWVTERLRFGVTAMSEKTGTADQTAISADILYRYSEGSFAKLEYARTRGPGFSNSLSSDGGLIIDDQPVASGNGDAVRGEFRVDFADVGIAVDGHIAAYFEDRSEGFSTLDYQVLAATGDEKLWGFDIDVKTNERLSWSVYYDDYSNAVGEYKREGGLELTYKASERLSYALGVEHIDRNTGTEIGDRTDAALRLTMTPNDQLSWYVFGQVTLQGTLRNNDRLGAGLSYDLANGWTIEGEISDGTLGTGGKALVSYKSGDDRSFYFGYEMDPGRELTGVTLSGRDRGRFVIGGRRRINDSLVTFGENNYDVFGKHRSLTSSYGVEYSHSDSLTYTMAMEAGTINDSVNGNFDRHALSFGVQYGGEALTAQGRLELRRERGILGTVNRDVDSYLLTVSARYKINEEQRLVFSLDAAKTDAFGGAPTTGDLVDVNFGYAFRPINHDRLNVLLRYRYLYDMYGQQVDGTPGVRPRQKSHVFSIDADYDLNERWSVGGKLGFRLSETSPDSTTAFTQNDAILAIVNARYHLVHNWDILIEARSFRAVQAHTTDFGFLAAAYRHMGNNVKLGIGYNFGRFSDDITDLSQDDKGLFINLIAKF